MTPLDESLRNKLECTIWDARDIVETEARAVLEQLGVGEASPYSGIDLPAGDLPFASLMTILG
jgi:hypothetical protein